MDEGGVQLQRSVRSLMPTIFRFSFLAFMVEKPIPNNSCSPNIARIMGTNTSAFELLVLKRKIMGPCWINIKRPVVENKGVSSRPISSE
jgi:hypothetical protein